MSFWKSKKKVRRKKEKKKEKKKKEKKKKNKARSEQSYTPDVSTPVRKKKKSEAGAKLYSGR
jgi:hypothetical protein